MYNPKNCWTPPEQIADPFWLYWNEIWEPRYEQGQGCQMPPGGDKPQRRRVRRRAEAGRGWGWGLGAWFGW